MATWLRLVTQWLTPTSPRLIVEHDLAGHLDLARVPRRLRKQGQARSRAHTVDTTDPTTPRAPRDARRIDRGPGAAVDGRRHRGPRSDRAGDHARQARVVVGARALALVRADGPRA